MTSRLIYVQGCDDATAAVLDLTDAEYEVAKRIAAAINEHAGGCHPGMETKSAGEPHYGWTEHADYTTED